METDGEPDAEKTEPSEFEKFQELGRHLFGLPKSVIQAPANKDKTIDILLKREPHTDTKGGKHVIEVYGKRTETISMSGTLYGEDPTSCCIDGKKRFDNHDVPAGNYVDIAKQIIEEDLSSQSDPQP